MPEEKKVLITRRRLERVTFHMRRSAKHLTCADCGGQSVMLSLENASLVCDITVLAVVRLLESGQIHFAELPTGSLLVCVRSLEAVTHNFKLGENIGV